MALPTGRLKKFSYFIGIDVSKDKLDMAILRGKQFISHSVIGNTCESVEQFLNELRNIDDFKISKTVFCLENTGFYSNHLLFVLRKCKANVIMENALLIKNSLGLVRGKDDKLDSIRIARFAERNKEEYKLWKPKRPVLVTLMHLVTIRNRLMGIRVNLKTPLKEQSSFVIKSIHIKSQQLCKKSLMAIEEDIIKIESEILALVNADAELKRLFQIILSVPSVGSVTALQIIICTNEFKDITDPKKFACYAGVAPFKKESGKMIRRSSVSQIANKDMKRLLHMCAMGSLRISQEMKDYFDRKTKKEGKPGMLVINAIRYKIILRIFACLKGNRHFEKNHIPMLLPQRVE